MVREGSKVKLPYSPGLLSLKVVWADLKLLKHIELMLEYLIVQCKLSLKVVRVDSKVSKHYEHM